MPSLIEHVKPLVDRGTNLTVATLAKVPGPAGAIGRRLGRSAPKDDVSDPMLKTKVESALYRTPGVTGSKVKVTVAEGLVTVHGEAASQAQMAMIETAVRSVPEVRAYEGRLHLPKTAAPSTPKAGIRKATAKQHAAETNTAARGRTERVDREKPVTTVQAEPAPKDLAAARIGRQPAPLGSKDPDTP